ncbi:cullin family protein [Cryptosporidium muris RN66]|uniref:Cullin family protein n=1 Tax=Cryptosporidium muris (strain RN66) TaxID=441375 RepID=B6AG52_CRYMR|nr:cullin family protein [Cryptosporidium muris RN66]EEA07193.1 cullin family protein [Cryptosporidium muris RN66]|eukprot:XP_002141542.1 cullin family protein [Cryptosporidium muris RN66]
MSNKIRMAGLSPFLLESYIDEETAISLYSIIYNSLEYIERGQSHKLSFEILYRSCYRLTLNKYGGMLYGGILFYLMNYLRIKSTEEATLEKILETWEKYEINLSTLRDVLMYLEKNYVLPNTKMSIFLTGMCLFRQFYLETRTREDGMINNILYIIEIYRTTGEYSAEKATVVNKILKKLYELPSEIVDIQLLPTEMLDSPGYQDSNSIQLNKEPYSYPSFVVKVPRGDLGSLKTDFILLLINYKKFGTTTNLEVDQRIAYKTLFQEKFLSYTISYYNTIVEKYISNDQLNLEESSEFLQACEEYYLNEKSLVEKYLVTSIWEDLISTLDHIWIVPFCDKFLANITSDSCIYLQLKFGEQTDLQRLFRIMSRVQKCFLALKNSLRNFINLELLKYFDTKILNKESNSIEYIFNIENLKNRCKFLLDDCFRGYPDFAQTINLAFEEFLQKSDSDFINNWIANGLDKIIRNSFINNNILEENKVLDTFLWLFKFIPDKDMFEIIYRRLLCRRMLDFPDAKRDLEHYVLVKFRSECGFGYSVKMEGVLADLMQSELLNCQYKQFNSPNIISKIEPEQIKYNILTSGYWLIDKHVDCCISEDIEIELSKFLYFFETKHERRKLQWNFSIGKAQVTINYQTEDLVRSCILECTTLQMIVLYYLFNEFNSMTFGKIQDILKCSDLSFLKMNLSSLCYDKENSPLRYIPNKNKNHNYTTSSSLDILRNSSKHDRLTSKNISSLQEVWFIPDFEKISYDDYFEVNINQIYQKKTQDIIYLAPLEYISNKTDESKKTEDIFSKRINEDRSHLIDSAIIKVLKKHKSLHTDDIVSKVMTMTEVFQPTKGFILSRVTSLSERDFIATNPDSPYIYNYIP